MNNMIAALQNSRAAGPEAPALDAPGAHVDAEAGPGDALLDKLAGIEAKLDKICAAMNIDGAAGKEPSEKEAKEATPNDDGY